MIGGTTTIYKAYFFGLNFREYPRRCPKILKNATNVAPIFGSWRSPIAWRCQRPHSFGRPCRSVLLPGALTCLDALAMPGFMVKHGEGSYEKHLISWDSRPTSVILPLEVYEWDMNGRFIGISWVFLMFTDFNGGLIVSTVLFLVFNQE